jgi:hypothetical protein
MYIELYSQTGSGISLIVFYDCLSFLLNTLLNDSVILSSFDNIPLFCNMKAWPFIQLVFIALQFIMRIKYICLQIEQFSFSLKIGNFLQPLWESCPTGWETLHYIFEPVYNTVSRPSESMCSVNNQFPINKLISKEGKENV